MMTILERLADIYGQPVAVVKALLQTRDGCITLGLNPDGPLGEQIVRIIGDFDAASR